MAARPVIEITFCRLCGWGLRAGWMAQELLTTFAEEVGSVMLTPDASGGVFDVRVDGQLIWSRKERGRFPESKELKQLVRDRIMKISSGVIRKPPPIPNMPETNPTAAPIARTRKTLTGMSAIGR